MSRKHNTRHPERGRSTYAAQGKAAHADRYGQYRDGRQITPDRLARDAESFASRDVADDRQDAQAAA